MSFEFKHTLTQVIAFLLMLWILNRYMWKPLLSLLDERTQRIQSLFKQAEDKNVEADALKKSYEKKIEASGAEGQALIQQAVREAKKHAEGIEKEAHLKGEKILLKAQEQSLRDIERAQTEFKKEIANISIFATEKLLKAKLSTEEKDRFTLIALDELS